MRFSRVILCSLKIWKKNSGGCSAPWPDGGESSGKPHKHYLWKARVARFTRA